MAFCTNCGASVTGAFCEQCGTPARSASAKPDAAQAVPPIPAASAPPYVPPASPQRRRTSPIVWILIIFVGLLVVGGIGTVATGWFVMNKVRQAGVDPELMQRNPGYAVAKMIVTANPNLEEVSHDDDAGTITVRDRRTGKETTLNFEDIKNGKLKITTDSEDGRRSSVEFGAGEADLPGWVPRYPGAKERSTFSVRGDGNGESGDAGHFSFRTSDPPTQVIAFYQAKAQEAGLQVRVEDVTSGGGVVIAEEDGGRSLRVSVGSGTQVNVVYASKH